MRFLFIFSVFILHLTTVNIMAQYLITKIETWHCKKGWTYCEKCAAMYDYTYTLLLLNPSDNPQAARPMIETKQGLATYDIKQRFNSLEEAQAYSKTHHVPIEIALEDKYPTLRQLSEKLPKKWFLKIDSTNRQLEIYSPQTLYIYSDNKINAPAFVNIDKAEIAKKEGKKSYPSIKYTIKKPLTTNEKQTIKQTNAEITRKIEELPQKYNIQHLKPEYVHGKNVYPNYPNATEEEKKRIQAYQNELEILEKQYLPTPMYSTPEFDLWGEIITGIETATESVYPEHLSRETYNVRKIARDFFSTISQK